MTDTQSRKPSLAMPRSMPTFPSLTGWGWALVIIVIVVAGGSNPYYPLPRGITEIVGVLIIGAAIAVRPERSRMCAPDWIALAGILLIAVQLIPLPAQVWTAFPGRDFAVQIDRAFRGTAMARPLSLDPEQTIRAGLTLLPALGTYMAVRLGGEGRARAMLAGLVIGGGLACLLAVSQRISGSAEWSYLYEISDRPFVNGFFTNHNHLASFLACAVPLGLAWQSGLVKAALNPPATIGQGPNPIAYLAGTSAILLFIACILLSGSRAGLAVMALMVGFSVASIAIGGGRAGRSAAMAIGGGLVLLCAPIVMLSVSGQTSVEAFDRLMPLAEDERLNFWPVAIDAARQYFPVGSGFGTFPDIYAIHEPLDLVRGSYVNHAHDDYIELVLEGGLPALLLMVTFVIWLVHRTISLFMTDRDTDGVLPARLCSVAIWCVMFHSLVDYPLRTAAISTAFALALAMTANQKVKEVAG